MKWRAVPACYVSALSRDSHGTASVEFAIAGSFLALLLVGIYDFATVGRRYIEVGNAARAGAAHVARVGWDLSKVKDVVTSATANGAIAASPEPRQFCGCAAAGGNIVETTCGTICADKSTANSYVQVNASTTYTYIMSYPGHGDTRRVSASAIARVQP